MSHEVVAPVEALGLSPFEVECLRVLQDDESSFHAFVHDVRRGPAFHRPTVPDPRWVAYHLERLCLVDAAWDITPAGRAVLAALTGVVMARCKHPDRVMVRFTRRGRWFARTGGPWMLCRQCGSIRIVRHARALLPLAMSEDWGGPVAPDGAKEHRYTQGTGIAVVRVKGHPRSLPTHPARWT